MPSEDKTVNYVNLSEDASLEKQWLTGQTNPETWSLMKDKFVVLRNFIPKEITNMALDSWKTIEGNDSYDEVIFHNEEEPIPGSPESSKNTSKAGYCTPMGVALHRWLWDNLAGKIDMQLSETYSYTRKYERGAYLRAHTDRPSCEISATICLDYHTDDGKPWSIWVQNDENYVDEFDMTKVYDISQSLPHRKRNGIKIDLEVGDVLLYQGPNVIHWRDTFLGDYSYHIFLHFFNTHTNLRQIEGFRLRDITKRPNKTATERFVTALDYDGRDGRYGIEDQTSKLKDNLKTFANNYYNMSDKHKYCNHYDDLKLLEEVETTRKPKKNDRI